jgi:hypothetical protein
MIKSVAIATLVALTMATSASAAIVESFDDGSWGTGWSNTGAGSVTTSSAHDGAYGVSLNESAWTYNTTIIFTPGQTLSAWFRPTSSSNGRFYLGFGANELGADSFVAATNTQDIRFQNNPSFDFEELNIEPQQWSTDWYLLSVTWNSDGSAKGSLFASDGTTLLNSVSQSGLNRSATGIALRGFGGFDVDTVSVTAVPESSTLALFVAGLAVAVGASQHRRRQSN